MDLLVKHDFYKRTGFDIDKIKGKVERMLGTLGVAPIYKQSKGWIWIGSDFLTNSSLNNFKDLNLGDFELSEKVGLLWVYGKDYKTIQDFNRESKARGMAIKIGAIPKGFEVGKTAIGVGT